ncbi:hypothetical protein [Phenylobacterium sp.]|uniref:hypothetical protein n=1 Tax=Phenylobacterium sp. TaxID=1871053 RepID=UPI0035B45E82
MNNETEAEAVERGRRAVTIGESVPHEKVARWLQSWGAATEAKANNPPALRRR